MAEQLLDGAQIGAPLQQVRGEGVAQGMRGHLPGRDAGADGDLLDQQVEGVAGQVPGFSPRWEEMHRSRLARGMGHRFLLVASAEPGRERHAGRGRERHHSLLAALAADQQHARICDGFIEALAVLLVHELRLSFLQPVERIGCLGVLGLIRMDQEGFDAIAFLDVGLGHTGLEVENCIALNWLAGWQAPEQW